MSPGQVVRADAPPRRRRPQRVDRCGWGSRVSARRAAPCRRFSPTCSAYAVESVQRHGVLMGLRLAAGRLLRCRPFGARGADPVSGRAGPAPMRLHFPLRPLGWLTRPGHRPPRSAPGGRGRPRCRTGRRCSDRCRPEAERGRHPESGAMVSRSV
ncbi:membrane protein insertion efficiency factor YidD [Micromonospora auratinigra]|uniref:membrane protein insertion efficiency factor YidD n=1 Tax=Micromonospora auratinigra TaxID=261654 RepID=UPI0018D4AF72